MGLNLKYTPIADDMLRNVALAQQAYDTIEKQYLDDISASGNWDMLADTEASKNTIANLRQQLSDAADDFIHNGYRPTSRRKYAELKRLIGSVITPRTAAYEKKEQLMREHRQKYGDDATYIGKTPDVLTLQNIIDNDYSKLYGVSGAQIEADAAQFATAASKRLHQQKPVESALYGQYLKTGDITGFTPEQQKQILDFEKALLNDENNEFNANVKLLHEKYGWNRFTNVEKAKFNDAIYSGFYKGLSFDENNQYHANRNYTATGAIGSPTYTPPSFTATYGVVNNIKDNDVFVKYLRGLEEMQKAMANNPDATWDDILASDSPLEYERTVPGMYGIPTPAKVTGTYADYFKYLKSQDKSGRLPYVVSDDELVFGNDAVSEPLRYINNSLQLTRTLNLNGADENVSAAKYFNNRLADGNITIQNEKGKPVKNHRFSSNAPMNVTLSSDGKLVIQQYDTDGEKQTFYASGDLIDQRSIIAFTNNDGKTYTYTPDEAMKRMKDLYTIILSGKIGERKLSEQQILNLIAEHTQLHESVMNALFSLANNRPLEQTSTEKPEYTRK